MLLVKLLVPQRKQRHLCFVVERSHTTTKNLLFFWGGHRLAFGGDLFPSLQYITIHVRVAWFIDSGITYTLMLSARTRTLAINVIISLCAALFDTACGTSFSSSPRAAGGGRTGWLSPTTGISMPTSTPPPSGWRTHLSTQVCDTTYQVRCLSMFYSLRRISHTVSSISCDRLFHFFWRHRLWHMKMVRLRCYRYVLLLLLRYLSNTTDVCVLGWCFLPIITSLVRSVLMVHTYASPASTK